jgi:hypothetical protein
LLPLLLPLLLLLLQELTSEHRVVLSAHGSHGSSPEQLFNLLAFISPVSYEDMNDVIPASISNDVDQQVCAGL